MVISYLHEGQCPEYQEDGTMAVSGRYGKLPMPDKGETINLYWNIKKLWSFLHLSKGCVTYL